MRLKLLFQFFDWPETRDGRTKICLAGQDDRQRSGFEP